MLSCSIHTPISPKECKSSSFSAFDQSFVIAFVSLTLDMDLEQVLPPFLLLLQSGFPHCLKGIQKLVVFSVLCDNVFSFELWTCSNCPGSSMFEFLLPAQQSVQTSTCLIRILNSDLFYEYWGGKIEIRSNYLSQRFM